MAIQKVRKLTLPSVLTNNAFFFERILVMGLYSQSTKNKSIPTDNVIQRTQQISILEGDVPLINGSPSIWVEFHRCLEHVNRDVLTHQRRLVKDARKVTFGFRIVPVMNSAALRSPSDTVPSPSMSRISLHDFGCDSASALGTTAAVISILTKSNSHVHHSDFNELSLEVTQPRQAATRAPAGDEGRRCVARSCAKLRDIHRPCFHSCLFVIVLTNSRPGSL